MLHAAGQRMGDERRFYWQRQLELIRMAFGGLYMAGQSNGRIQSTKGKSARLGLEKSKGRLNASRQEDEADRCEWPHGSATGRPR